MIPAVTPAIVITIPFEGQLRVVINAINDGEEARIRDWASHPGYKALIDAALDLRDSIADEAT